MNNNTRLENMNTNFTLRNEFTENIYLGKSTWKFTSGYLKRMNQQMKWELNPVYTIPLMVSLILGLISCITKF